MMEHLSQKLDILRCYHSDYNRLLNGREISRLINRSPQTTLRNLRELSKKNVLSCKRLVGRVDYGIKNSVFGKQMLVLMENYRSSEVLKGELGVFVKEVLPLCDSFIIFGSFADGSFSKDSDIDIICINGNIDSVVKRFPREVNVENITWAGLKRSVSKPLFEEIRKKHLYYGNVSKIIDIVGGFTR